MKRIYPVIIFCLAGAADIFSGGSGVAALLLAFACAFLVFQFPRFPITLSRPVSIMLFAANLLFLGFLYSHRVYLINMLFLSFLVWGALTPHIMKYRALLPLSVLTAFVSAYAAAFSDYPVPLFPLVYYPVYLAGISSVRKGIPFPEKKYFFFLVNVLLCAAFITAVCVIPHGKAMFAKMLFLQTSRDGAVNPVYYPFMALFLIWFSSAFIVSGYMLASKRGRNVPSTDFSSFHTLFRRFLPFAAVLFFAMFACEFSSRLSVWGTLAALGRPSILFNFLILCGGYLCLLSLVGRGISNLVVAVLTVFIAAANSIKFFYFDEPFYPWDLYLIKNMVSISKEYLSIAAVMLCLAAAAGCAAFFYRNWRAVSRYLKPRSSLILLPFAGA
ncbi:MAG: hypothetical protein ACRCUT_06735, partial [Spirochaetota bacterium]